MGCVHELFRLTITLDTILTGYWKLLDDTTTRTLLDSATVRINHKDCDLAGRLSYGKEGYNAEYSAALG